MEMTAVNALDLIKIDTSALSVSGSSTDAEITAAWMSGLAERSKLTYERALKDFTLFSHGKPIRLVTLRDLQMFAEDLEDHGFKPATIKTKINAVKSLFSFAQKDGYIFRNPGALMRIIKTQPSLNEKILTVEEVRRLIRMEPKPRNKAILKMLYVTGMRVSELVGLRWKDVRLGDSGDGIITIHGKGRKLRNIPVPWSVVEEAIKCASSAGLEAPVFLSKYNGAFDPSSVERIVKGAAIRAKVRNCQSVSPHTLRHCHATHSLRAGCPLDVLKETLGHASLETTAIYLHIEPGDGSSNYIDV